MFKMPTKVPVYSSYLLIPLFAEYELWLHTKTINFIYPMSCNPCFFFITIIFIFFLCAIVENFVKTSGIW